MHLGYYEEARAWRNWLFRAVAGSPDQVQILYGVGGERWLPELNVSWLPGYEKSSVRIGNAADQQMQLDVFWEVADATFQTLKAGMEPPERARALRPVLFEYLATAWRQPTKAFGRFVEGRSTSSIRRSWPGLHSIAPRMSSKRSHSGTRGSASATSPMKFMPKSVARFRPRPRRFCAGLWLQAARRQSAVVQVFGRRQHERRLALRRPASKKRQGTKSREAWERLGGERYGDFRLAPSSLGGATLGRRCLDACTQGWARE